MIPEFPNPFAAPDDRGFSFHFEEDHLDIEDTRHLETWLLAVIDAFGFEAGKIAFHFVSDEDLLEINTNHLNHDYYTDIITFPYAFDPIEGEIFISVDRVMENASDEGVENQYELLRVIVHGILHLCGLTDTTPEDANTMRKYEDQWLDNWSSAGYIWQARFK